MGRHHKASILPSSSSKVDFIPNPITKGLAEVKRYIWRPTKVSTIVQLAILVTFTACFLWTLRRLPQDHDYPDGACPTSSYQILGENNEIIGCEPCPECPSGLQLTPPCGSLTHLKTFITCTLCPSETYKEGHGRGKCMPCQKCSPRETIRPCTPTTNTQCGDCPRGYYQEGYVVDSCRKCSTCCAMKRFAELECIYLKKCMRTNCSQEIEFGNFDAQKLDLALRRLRTPRRITPPRPVPLQRVPNNLILQKERNLVLQDMVSQFKRTKVKRGVQLALQGANTLGPPFAKMATEAIPPLRDISNQSSHLPDNLNSSPPLPDISNPATTDTIVRFTNQSKSQGRFGTVPNDNTASSRPTSEMASNYFGINFKLVATLIALLGILILVLISIGVLVACACCKNQSGEASGYTVTCCAKYIYLANAEDFMYLPVQSDTTHHTDYDNREVSNNGSNGHLEQTFCEEVKGLLLTKINPDLKDILTKRLDVRHKGQYGWKKLGSAMGIDELDLKYWETAYYFGPPLRGPTELLLEKLGAKSPDLTVGDLIDTLQDPKVNRPDVVLHIRQHLQNVRN